MKLKYIVSLPEKKEQNYKTNEFPLTVSGHIREQLKIEGFNQAIDEIGELEVSEDKLRELGYVQYKGEDSINIIIEKAKPFLNEYGYIKKDEVSLNESKIQLALTKARGCKESLEDCNFESCSSWESCESIKEELGRELPNILERGKDERQ